MKQSVGFTCHEPIGPWTHWRWDRWWCPQGLQFILLWRSREIVSDSSSSLIWEGEETETGEGEGETSPHTAIFCPAVSLEGGQGICQKGCKVKVKGRNQMQAKRKYNVLRFCLVFFCFCIFMIFHYLSSLVYCYYFSFPDSVSHYALVFPSHISVFLCYVNPSTPEYVSSHSSVISGSLAFSEFFLHSSFSWFPTLLLIYIVINSPVLCSS